MKAKTFSWTVMADDADSVFQDQTLGSATTFDLNGADVNTDGVWVSPDGLAHTVRFGSNGNDSGITATIAGFRDTHQHIAVSEVVTLANAGNAHSTAFFSTITSITTSGATASDVECGVVANAGGTGCNVESPIIPMDYKGSGFTALVTPSGTTTNLDLDVMYTAEPLGDIDQNTNWAETDLNNVTTAVKDTIHTQQPTAIKLRTVDVNAAAAFECQIAPASA